MEGILYASLIQMQKAFGPANRVDGVMQWVVKTPFYENTTAGIKYNIRGQLVANPVTVAHHAVIQPYSVEHKAPATQVVAWRWVGRLEGIGVWLTHTVSRHQGANAPRVGLSTGASVNAGRGKARAEWAEQNGKPLSKPKPKVELTGLAAWAHSVRYKKNRGWGYVTQAEANAMTTAPKKRGKKIRKRR